MGNSKLATSATIMLVSLSFAVNFQVIAQTSVINPQTLDRLHAPILRSDLKLLGAQSCAAASCHGGPHPGVAQPWISRGSEYPLWFENDPHSLSWKTISSAQSVAMMQKLKIMRGDKIVDQKGFDNCLACHNTTKRFHEPRSAVERKEGIGCAGCHGPDELWNGTHFQFGFDPLNSTDIGFVANGDLLTRARTCAACHVGDQDRDMNHDIIAAGHPALRYELATFHAWEPKHWRDAEANDRTLYEAQIWLAGQIAAADASLSLLQARATKHHTVSEWPELSAYDCSACHHNLGLKNARRAPRPDGKDAIAPLSAWNTAGLLWVIRYRMEQGEATREDEQLALALDAVREIMEAGPKPDPVRTAAIVAEARVAIACWVAGAAGQSEKSMFRSDRLGRIAASAAGKTRSFDTWESAVQLYLATVAARESWPDGPSGPLHDSAERLRRGLAYPELTSSPEYALRHQTGVPATRAEVRQMTVELTRWLGPMTLDGEPMPVEDEASPEQLQRQIEQLLNDVALRLEKESKSNTDKAETQGEKPTKPSADEVPVVPPVRPTLTPEELENKLKALQGDSSDN